MKRSLFFLVPAVISLIYIYALHAFAEGPREDIFAAKRQEMVRTQIKRRGVSDPRILDAMTRVKRHLFVPDEFMDMAYDDHPLPIGLGQTISQPYIVAYMTEQVQLRDGDRVLEIGTGSGYQAAILAEIVKEVYTIEILKPLADNARKKLKNLGYENVHVRHGDGYKGWPEFMPYDAIIVTAAPEEIPEILTEQLKIGGRMIVPVGTYYQELYLLTKTENGISRRKLIPVRFVPMVSDKR